MPVDCLHQPGSSRVLLVAFAITVILVRVKLRADPEPRPGVVETDSFTVRQRQPELWYGLREFVRAQEKQQFALGGSVGFADRRNETLKGGEDDLASAANIATKTVALRPHGSNIDEVAPDGFEECKIKGSLLQGA